MSDLKNKILKNTLASWIIITILICLFKGISYFMPCLIGLLIGSISLYYWLSLGYFIFLMNSSIGKSIIILATILKFGIMFIVLHISISYYFFGIQVIILSFSGMIFGLIFTGVKHKVFER